MEQVYLLKKIRVKNEIYQKGCCEHKFHSLENTTVVTVALDSPPNLNTGAGICFTNLKSVKKQLLQFI